MPTFSISKVPLEEVIPTNDYAVLDGSLTDGEFEMAPGMYNVRCSFTVSADTTIYLPPISTTTGSLYSIFVVSVAGGYKVIVRCAKQDAPSVFDAVDLTGSESYVLLLNVGDRWKTLNFRS